GGMSSRLFQEIREKRGLAYSVYSFGSGYADSGYFGLYAGQDTMTSRDTVTTFAQKHHAELTVYEPGEHWFHTPAQLNAMQTWEQAHR
ncbi:MAG TPA: insulinase family protein, partial [Gemmiger qucibialis]|nr:insulinase family protein [Gemmiger qucibialis]